jgi:two-component system, sensor histidine kinase
MRILVCDDNADAAETLRALLASDGHEVIALRDSRVCLEKALEWVPEVAFLDVGMPGLTGYALARQIRARFGRRILLVAVTGYGSQEDKTVAFEVGFDMHLVKPVQPAKLLSIAANRQHRAGRVG